MMQVQTTRRWFEGRARRLWRVHLEPLPKVAVYAECGVYEASSLLWAAEHMVAPGGKAIGIDPWSDDCLGGNVERVRKVYATACERVRMFNQHHLDRRVELVRARSENVLRNWHRLGLPQPDIYYVDGVHHAPEALFDMVLAWTMLPVGGLLVVDDINYKVMGRRGKRGPEGHEAWQAFKATHAKRLEMVFETDMQAAIRKLR